MKINILAPFIRVAIGLFFPGVVCADVAVFNLGANSSTSNYSGGGLISYFSSPNTINWGFSDQTIALYQPANLAATFGPSNQWTVAFAGSYPLGGGLPRGSYNLSSDLDGSFLYVNNIGGTVPTNFGSFLLAGFSPTDFVTVEVSSSQNRALAVNFSGSTGIATQNTYTPTSSTNASGNWFLVGTLSGNNSYNGTFGNVLNASGYVSGSGAVEADLSAIRVTVGSTPPGPSYIGGYPFQNVTGFATASSGTLISNNIPVFNSGSWLAFTDIGFTNAAFINFQLAWNINGGSFDVRLDGPAGPVVATCQPPTKFSLGAIIQQSFILAPTNGVHTVYLVGNVGSNMCNLASFKLSAMGLVEPQVGNYIRVWGDDFPAGTSLDTSKWSAQPYNGAVYNSEQEIYTTRTNNLFITAAGGLDLRGLHDNYVNPGGTTNTYTSGKVTSVMPFRFGKYEVKARLPIGLGSWPAIWLFGTQAGNLFWPNTGEIDIMEQRGTKSSDKTWFQSNTWAGSGVNGGGGQSDYPDAPGTTDNNWPGVTINTALDNVYTFIWSPTSMQFFFTDAVSGNTTLIRNSTFAANSPEANNSFNLILNTALGGQLGGTIDNTAFPMDMVVDYVHVSKLDSNGYGVPDEQQFTSKLSGTPIDPLPYFTGGGDNRSTANAFDGNVNTICETAAASGGYTDYDLGTNQLIGRIRFYAVGGGYQTYMTGGAFLGANKSDFSDAVSLYTIFNAYAGWNDVNVGSPANYRYLRYLSPTNGYTLVAEIEYYTSPTASSAAWVPDASSSWGTPGNWSSAISPYGVDNIATFTNFITQTRTITLPANLVPVIGGLVFSASGTNNWILTGGNGISLTTTNGLRPIIAVNNGTATLTTSIYGTEGLLKTGTGTLVLGGIYTNSGGIYIQSGVLQAGAAGAFGGQMVTVSSGATFDANGFTLNPSATIVAAGTGPTGNGALVNTGSQAGIQNLILTGNTMMSDSAAGLNVFGTITGGGYALNISGNGYVGVGTGTSDLGDINILSGSFLANGYLGNLNNCLGRTTNTVTVASAGTLGLVDSSTTIFNKAIVLNGGLVKEFLGGSPAIAGLVTLNSNSTFDVTDSLTLSAGVGGAGGLVKVSAGTLTLSGVSSYGGNTTVYGGTLVLNNPCFSNTSTVAVAAGAKLNLNFSASNTIAGLVLNGVSQPPGVYSAATDPTYLSGSGSLFVASALATNPPTLALSVSANQLTINWPTNRLGWLLQSNSMNLSVAAEWYDISNTAFGTIYTIIFDPSQSNVFYRLRLP